jgi:hypothetical protein
MGHKWIWKAARDFFREMIMVFQGVTLSDSAGCQLLLEHNSTLD